VCTAKREKRQLISLGSPDQVEQKRREERISPGTELAVTTWRPAAARDAVARARESSKGGEQG
jgi:hypothetical protein